jgi:hypothetical protein
MADNCSKNKPNQTQWTPFVPNPKQQSALEGFTYVPKDTSITPCLFESKLV